MKLYGIRQRPTHRIRRDEEKQCSLNPSFVSLYREPTVLFWGCWASIESLTLNNCADGGIQMSPHPQPRNQRRKGPRVKHGPQTWLAAREDTHSAGLLYWKRHNLASLSSLSMRENPSFSVSSRETKEPGSFLQDVC